MNTHSPLNDRLQSSLSRLNIETLAKESGWITRENGRISPLSFCMAMLAATNIATASLRTVAFLSGILSGECVSKQAIHKRLNDKALKLFENLLAAAMSSKCESAILEQCPRFKRIILQDSTSIALPPHLIKTFKGAKNGVGEGAGLKIHTSFDLTGKRFTDFHIREARSADQAFALDGTNGLGEGDLLLRDLGYFSIGSFRELKRNGADILTRCQPKVSLMDPETLDTIDLMALFRRRRTIDVDVLAGAKERLPMRLIAFRLPKAIAQQRRRNLKRRTRKKSRTPSRHLLALQDWQIYLTTCDRERLSIKNAMALYQQRWGIEILFKGFKSHMKIGLIPPSCSETMVRCLILSTLLRIVLTHVVVFPILLVKCVGKGEVSALKLYSLMEALAFQSENQRVKASVRYENLLRHCCYEKRKRKSLPQKLNALG